MDNDLRNEEINISLVQIGLFIRICGSSYMGRGNEIVCLHNVVYKILPPYSLMN